MGPRAPRSRWPGSNGLPPSGATGRKPLVGDLTAENLGLTDEAVAELGAVDHIVHCAAIYDITADEADQRAANVEGTRAVIDLARRLDATLHHVSSIAVAGTYHGEFTEDDFDVAQDLPTPYHQTKFEAELLVRSAAGTALPGVPARGRGRRLPHRRNGQDRRPVLLLRPAGEAGRVAEVHPDGAARHRPHQHRSCRLCGGSRRRDSCTPTVATGRPSTSPPRKPLGCAASTAASPRRQACRRFAGHCPVRPRHRSCGPPGAPRWCATWPPPSSAYRVRSSTSSTLRPTFTSANTAEALRGTGITVPEFASYAPKLWRYWAEHLDPDRARRDDPAGPLVGKHVIITGASSGIGRASAIAVAERGATVFALARNAEALDDLIAEIRAAGGQAHAFTCDVTDSTSVEHTVKDILGRFGHVDYLVNNAGRSIRRSVIASTDRLHDYERVMAVNYFGAVRMVLALLPHWRERRFGHVVNVSSAGVQANGPKYSAYLPSKAALDAFADVVSTETLSDHITFTNIHMPLVKTPMIVPSRRLNPIPPISPEHAAAMVVRGLVEKPARIDTPVGTLADFGNYMTPKLSRRILHQLYLGYPDSAAARGVAPAEPSTSFRPVAAAQAPDTRGRVAADSAARFKPIKRAVRLVPGVHW